MNGPKCRKYGALWAISQGLLTALLPQVTVKLLKLLIGQNFENAEKLEAKPGYLRQLRALGIGLAAAGVAGYAMEHVVESREAAKEAETKAEMDESPVSEIDES